MNQSLRDNVIKVLRDVEPALGLHGGGVKLVEITADRVVRLKFEGACVGCPAADYTLEYGLKEILMTQIPEIEDVEAVYAED